MGSRGRGRGRGGGGGGMSLSAEQLSGMGATANDPSIIPITEPPPLFPPLDRKPQPLPESVDINYMLILRQDFIDHMQISGSFLKLPEEEKNCQPQEEIEKLLAQLPSAKDKFDWDLYPSELRPKVFAKRNEKKVKKVDVEVRLNKLEQIEENMDKSTEEKSGENEAVQMEEEEVFEMENYEDEDIDDGTDYANNYFDNGEAYEEEEDNLDDGPIY